MIAKALLPGDDPGGLIITTLIGIAGAFIGGLIVKALGFGDPIDEFLTSAHGSERSEARSSCFSSIALSWAEGRVATRPTEADSPERAACSWRDKRAALLVSAAPPPQVPLCLGTVVARLLGRKP